MNLVSRDCQDCGSTDSVSPRPARIADQADYGPLHSARATRADLVSSRTCRRIRLTIVPCILPVCGSDRLHVIRDLPGELTDLQGKVDISFLNIRAAVDACRHPPPGHSQLPHRQETWKNLGWSKYRGDSAEFSAEV
ncbi:hypothetical protein Prudu_013027 [Prunus dulcis]|uniref:Uncharacterized protein n=1 Tax=Prunus dulcis TaxID=3755 RepID=A0A4Y1RE05_PRUDU|nr:hypothetical protein Prudu_013027 [Prunus dulcis]